MITTEKFDYEHHATRYPTLRGVMNCDGCGKFMKSGEINQSYEYESESTVVFTVYHHEACKELAITKLESMKERYEDAKYQAMDAARFL